MKIACRSCRADIPPDNINIQAAIAKCDRCGSVFGFAEEVPGSTASLGRERPRVEMPKRLQVSDIGSELAITRTWFGPVAVFMVFFVLFWDGFLVVWYSIAFATGEWFMAAFASIHAAVGVGMTYFTLCSFVNRTTITVREGRLSVKHAPLPWFGNHELETSGIDQLFCTEHRHKNSQTYDVVAALREGKRIKLVGGLQSIEQALFIEQELERHLGVKDRPVAGEVPR